MPSLAKRQALAGQYPLPGFSASGTSSGPAGPETSEGNMAPNIDDHRGGADFFPALDIPEDTGAGNMGAGNDKSVPPEPIIVPSAPESGISTGTKPISSSPIPESSIPEASAVPPPCTATSRHHRSGERPRHLGGICQSLGFNRSIPAPGEDPYIACRDSCNCR
jgi:hypothetical protein